MVFCVVYSAWNFFVVQSQVGGRWGDRSVFVLIRSEMEFRPSDDHCLLVFPFVHISFRSFVSVVFYRFALILI